MGAPSCAIEHHVLIRFEIRFWQMACNRFVWLAMVREGFGQCRPYLAQQQAERWNRLVSSTRYRHPIWRLLNGGFTHTESRSLSISLCSRWNSLLNMIQLDDSIWWIAFGESRFTSIEVPSLQGALLSKSHKMLCKMLCIHIETTAHSPHIFSEYSHRQL